MDNKIFISYRRDDSSGYALALYNSLLQSYNKSQLFFDIDSIAYGEDFVDEIKQSIKQSILLLVLIGDNWIFDKNNNSQFDEKDFVLIEISEAIKQNKIVLPVVINEKNIPKSDDLPDTIKQLSNKQVFVIKPITSKNDIEELIEIVKKYVSKEKKEYSIDNFFDWTKYHIRSFFTRTLNSIKSIKSNPEHVLPIIRSEKKNYSNMLTMNSLFLLLIFINILFSINIRIWYFEERIFYDLFNTFLDSDLEKIIDLGIFGFMLLGMFFPFILYLYLNIFCTFFLAPHYYYLSTVKMKEIKINFSNSCLYISFYFGLLLLILEVVSILMLNIAFIFFISNDLLGIATSEFIIEIILIKAPMIILAIFSIVFIILTAVYSTKRSFIYTSGNMIISLYFIIFYPILYIKITKKIVINLIDFISYVFGAVFSIILFIPYKILIYLGVSSGKYKILEK